MESDLFAFLTEAQAARAVAIFAEYVKAVQNIELKMPTATINRMADGDRVTKLPGGIF